LSKLRVLIGFAAFSWLKNMARFCGHYSRSETGSSRLPFATFIKMLTLRCQPEAKSNVFLIRRFREKGMHFFAETPASKTWFDRNDQRLDAKTRRDEHAERRAQSNERDIGLPLVQILQLGIMCCFRCDSDARILEGFRFGAIWIRHSATASNNVLPVLGAGGAAIFTRSRNGWSAASAERREMAFASPSTTLRRIRLIEPSDCNLSSRRLPTQTFFLLPRTNTLPR
jgi:hypothetical protein